MPDTTARQSIDPYQTDGGKVYHNAVYGGLGKYGYSLVAKRRAAKLQRFIQPTDDVLEYGVGQGWNLAEIKAKSLKGFDVSVAVKPIVEAHGIEFTHEIISQDRSSYDIVICSHVLEHLSNPIEALTTLSDCLKPGGKALIYLPYDFERKFRKYDVAEPNHHLYCWNVQTFSNLVLAEGFKILEGKIQKFGYERIVAIWTERLRLPGWSYTFLLSVALFLKPAYELAFVISKKENTKSH